MGNAFVSQNGLDAALNNPAGLTGLKAISFSAFFENRYLLKDLSGRGILLGIPVGSGVFAAGLCAFGPAKWMETTFSVSYAKKLSSAISASIKINYLGMKLPEENRTLSSASVEMGIIYRFSPTIHAGLHLANPFSIPFKTVTHTDKIPFGIGLGGHAFITDNIILAIEACKTENQPIVFKTGIEWKLVENFYLRGGYNSGPSILFTGVGFNYRFITCDIAFSYHQVLGVTPVISFRFDIK
jgi:hypothetical protein